MDHPVAYDMVLEHVLHVRMGYMTHGVVPGAGMQEDKRQHYLIVISNRSNVEGQHWGMAVWGGTTCPEVITFVDPYDDPWRFEDACGGARRIGLRARALGAGHRTCGWRCGYICLWWSMWLGRKGEIPFGRLPKILPKMQKTFPRLCHSLLQGIPQRDLRPSSGEDIPPLLPVGLDGTGVGALGARASPQGLAPSPHYGLSYTNDFGLS